MVIEFIKDCDLFNHTFKVGDVITMVSIPAERNLIETGYAKEYVPSNNYSKPVALIRSAEDIPVYVKNLKKGLYEKRQINTSNNVFTYKL